jgi:hypothetical protein
MLLEDFFFPLSPILLPNLTMRCFVFDCLVSSIQTFACSTPYTTFPHKKFKKKRLKEIIQNTFKFRNNGKQRYKLILLRINLLYQVRNKLQKSTYTENEGMLEFFIDNIFVEFEVSSIIIGINCVPFLVDIFLYSYSVSRMEFI